MSTDELSERLSRVGVEGWKRAITAKAARYDADWAAYVAWSKTPRGRATLALRRIRNLPSRIRYAVAAFVYPGDLQRDLDDR